MHLRPHWVAPSSGHLLLWAGEVGLPVKGTFLDLQIRAQHNGPISQNREYGQYRGHYFGHLGGPGLLM